MPYKMEEKSEEKLGKQEDGSELVRVGDDLICKEHFFVYKSSTEVKCRKCPLGYPIGAETEIKEGHIFVKGQLVI